MRDLVRPLGRLAPRLHSVPLGGTVRIRVPGGASIRCVTDGLDPVTNQVFWGGQSAYEPELAGPFVELARQSQSAILDIGASTGLFSLLASAASPSAEVHAFEAVPPICGRLEANVRANPPCGIRIHNVAVADRAGEVEMCVPRSGLTTEASTWGGCPTRSPGNPAMELLHSPPPAAVRLARHRQAPSTQHKLGVPPGRGYEGSAGGLSLDDRGSE